MDHRTRMSRIRAAVRAERGRREKRAITGLSCICAMLCAAVSVLIRQEMGPGDFIVQESYGAVLLRGSQNACFMTALLAFLTGTVFTLLCIKLKERKKRQEREVMEYAESKMPEKR